MIIANKYKIIDKIGQGVFGDVFKGQNIRTHEFVAIKMEPFASHVKLLINETKILQYLGVVKGFPLVKWFGVHENTYYMVINLLGPSITHIKQKYNTFSLISLFKIVNQIIERLEYLHDNELIHRDVKPDNFLFGLDEQKELIYIIDFGFCKRYMREDEDGTKNHIEMTTANSIVGTPQFVSINIHKGLTPSRRDDIESVGYIMLYMLYDWAPSGDYIRIKQNVQSNERVLVQIRNILKYSSQLHFDERPNYEYIRELLQ